MLNEHVLDEVPSEVRGKIAAQPRDAQLSEMESELRNLRVEQKRLAKAVALADDAPELVTELRQRASRIHQIEAQILNAQRVPAELDPSSRRSQHRLSFSPTRHRPTMRGRSGRSG